MIYVGPLGGPMPAFWTELEQEGNGTNLVLQPAGVIVCSFPTFWQANAARIAVSLVAASCAYDALEVARSKLESAGFASVH